LKKATGLILAVVTMLSLNGCVSPSKIDQGQEGVLIYQPWFFGHGGVDPVPVKTGLVWTVWTTSVVKVDVRPFNTDEVFDDLVTKDNNPVDFKIHLTFKHIEGKTPVLVEKFGSDWYRNKVREPLRNSTRTFTKNHTMFEMTTDSAITDKLEQQVKKEVRAFLLREKMPTELVEATVGKVMPPATVIEATIQTAVQKQNVKTQQERVKAEESREKAERASANADKAYMKAIGMTAAQYLEMKRLEVQKLAIEAAKEGKADINIIMGNAQPMFNVGKP
jgi:regulator of protease activity HflC (stomatin/prohibitin superfamily)